jgi:predicted MFS family arabinose efflux permease
MLTRLLPLILGAFTIGTETFMIVGVLPNIAADLGVSPAAAGGLVTAFSLAYAIGSPILAVMTAGIERKRLLSFAMAGFALANALAAFAPSFAWLMAARVLLALTAGTFMPAAIALATAAHDAAHRGRAVALVYAGMTGAIVIGVPGGTIVAAAANWRATFLCVALLAAIAVVGIAAILPRLAGIAAIGLRERLAVGRRPDVLAMLGLTFLALCGTFAINTYLGVLLEKALGIDAKQLAGCLVLLGLVSFIGNLFGGYGADRWNRERFLATILAVLVVAFGLVSFGAGIGGLAGAVAILSGVALWGLFGWAFPSTQQARIVSLDPALAPITLSLNTSALYAGAAAGSVLGAVAIQHWSIEIIGWVGVLCEVAAFALLAATAGRRLVAAKTRETIAKPCPTVNSSTASAVS